MSMSGRIFGTDGIRGTANQYPMTAEIAMKFAMAAGNMFTYDEYRHRVVIAKDTRLSGYMIESALTCGFLSAGVDVILVGPMPTPSVPMLIKSLRADLGVMISASHNPYQDNGLKLFDKNGFKLTDEYENKLQDLMLNSDSSNFLTAPDKLGRAKRLDDASGRYVEHVKRSFLQGNISLSGLRIVIDCANGAAYNLAPQILWELGAEVIKIGCEPDGFNINLNCGSTHPVGLSQKVIETRADIGIALDGDADRLVVCDEKGKIIHGDNLIASIATALKQDKRLQTDSVIVTQMSNIALERYLKTIGLKTERTKIGDRYVFERMQETGSNFGAEQSGHIIMSDFSSTGDGLIAALQILAYMVKSKTCASKLLHNFEPAPQMLKNVKFKDHNPLEDNTVISKIEEIQADNINTRILVRKSGTEKLIRIMAEGEDQAQINNIITKIETVLS